MGAGLVIPLWLLVVLLGLSSYSLWVIGRDMAYGEPESIWGLVGPTREDNPVEFYIWKGFLALVDVLVIAGAIYILVMGDWGLQLWFDTAS